MCVLLLNKNLLASTSGSPTYLSHAPLSLPSSPLLLKAEERPSYQKQLSLCVFDDVLEFASSVCPKKFYGMTAKICVDGVYFFPQSAVKYQEYFLQPMLKCICDKSPTVRQVYKIRSISHRFVCLEYYVSLFQAASYGVGVMAQNCSKDFSQACLG